MSAGQKTKKTFPPSFWHFVRGLAMGTADVIPGVSGGTIAFITGIYPRLIRAIESFHLKYALAFLEFFFFFWRKERRQKALHKIKEIKELDWVFLFPLLGGLFCALVIMLHIVPFFLKNYPFYTYSFFSGLIIASIPIPLRQMRKKAPEILLLLFFTGLLFFLTGLTDAARGNAHPLFLIFSGALAICAMILPGISGSYILVLLGQYRLIAEAGRDGNFFILAFFFLGIFIGLLSFVKLLRFLLDNFKSLTMAALTGMMLGSLNGIWPLRFSTAGIDSLSLWIGGISIALLGAFLVLSLELLSKKSGGITFESSF